MVGAFLYFCLRDLFREYKSGGMLGIFGLFLEGHFSKNKLDVLVT